MVSSRVVTPLEGMLKYAKSQPDVNIICDPADRQLKYGKEPTQEVGARAEGAKLVAAESDVVVVLVGFNFRDEGEYIPPTEGQRSSIGGDRASLSLLSSDLQVLDAVHESGKPIILVYIGGGGIEISEDIDRKTSSILFAWYSGMEGGTALANVLFGAVSPSGKLPFTVPRDSLDLVSFDPSGTHADYNSLHGYFAYDRSSKNRDAPVVTPYRFFGYGMSYVTFVIDEVRMTSPSKLIIIQKEGGGVVENDGASLVMSCRVANHGSMRAKEVIQVYVSLLGDPRGEEAPWKSLKSFVKVELNPGEERIVEFSVPQSDLSRFDAVNNKWVVVEGDCVAWRGLGKPPGDTTISPLSVRVPRAVR